jgi:uncharacterized membrane protein YdjX (TVP38/TMEM64 family)
MKDTPAFLLAMASTIFVVGPGIALLELDLNSVWWRVTGVTLVILGLTAGTYWTIRNYRDWRREFPRARRTRGKTHKSPL